MALPWQDIPGWLTDAEGAALQALAAGRTVLEIGSYKGRSTACLALVARRVYALDWHQGDAGAGHGWTLPECSAHLFKRGLENKVVLLVGRTTDVGPVLADRLFDLAFLDGDHNEAAVRADLALAVRTLRPGGIVALHDWGEAGVRQAAAEVLGDAPAGRADSLAWFALPAPGGGG